MAPKRKRDADLPPPSSSTIHPSRKKLLPASHFASSSLSGPKSKKPNPFPAAPSRKKKHAIAPLKRRVRDLTRQLSRLEDLPADVRIAKERELQACEWDLRAEEAAVRRREMIGTYHMVRFFGE